MIHFKLKHLDEIQPAGTDGDFTMSWFWLTDGDLWLNLADSTLYEYTPEALKYFGDKKSPYNDYPLIRFIEDFTELFNEVSESIPNDIYKLTGNLTGFLNDSQKWLDFIDTDDDEYSDFYFEEYDKLISWTDKRTIDSGHLIGGPHISIFRNGDNIRIVWETAHQLENKIDLWTAKNGAIEISYSDFISQVYDFGKRFFEQMNTQVDVALKKDWKDVKIDKTRLIQEHAEREKDFFDQLALLEKEPKSATNWKLVEELHTRMQSELNTKA